MALPATTVDLRLALALGDSLAGVLELLGVGAEGAAAELRPGLLRGRPGAAELGSSASHADAPARATAGCPQILLVDPWDVPALVERGAADAGVAPKHVLAELQAELAEVLDLQVGAQLLAYVAPPAQEPVPAGRRLWVATAHPRLTRAHFARAGRQVETFALRSAAELAVALNAADGAVVPLPCTETRTADGLEVRAEVLRSSARLVVSRSARVVRSAEVNALVERLRAAVLTRTPEET